MVRVSDVTDTDPFAERTEYELGNGRYIVRSANGRLIHFRSRSERSTNSDFDVNNNCGGIDLEFFDPAREISRSQHRQLPHWSQAGTVAFITWRTWDSLPVAVIRNWISRRDAWLVNHGINPRSATYDSDIANLSLADRKELQQVVSSRWSESLDGCHGASQLRNTGIAGIVSNSLKYFDSVWYDLFDFVVMPNHVHLLASFVNIDGMRAQCKSWKHYTSVRINRDLGRIGHFWADDSFDHLIRSEEQFWFTRDYIASNPKKAGLKPGEYSWYSRPLDRPSINESIGISKAVVPDPFADRTEY